MKCVQLFICLLYVNLSVSSIFCPNPEDISPCTCEHDYDNVKTNINCSNATQESEIVAAFQASFPVKELDTFYIQNNQHLTELTQSTFNDITFYYFYLNNNQLESINGDFFDGMEHTLRSVNLENNSITSSGFPFYILPNMFSLQYLHLDFNAISILPAPIEVNVLLTVNLNSNSIISLSEGTFSLSSSMQLLHLESNRITNIDPGKSFDFKSFDKVCFIHLSSDYMKAISNFQMLFMMLDLLLTYFLKEII